MIYKNILLFIYAIFLPIICVANNPTINCPSDITLTAISGACSAIGTYTVTSDNTCPDETIFIIEGIGSGGSFPVGSTTNTWVVVDANGNADTCSFDVIVEEIDPPFIVCSTPIIATSSQGECGAFVEYEVQTVNNCGFDSIYIIDGIASGGLFPIGFTVNEFVAVNSNGMTDTCRFDVFVEDVEPPLPECPADIIVDADPNTCLAQVSYTLPDFFDNCGVDTVFQIAGLASNSFYPVGTTVNTFRVLDASGNEGFCSFSVIVEDGSNPGFVSCPEDITVNTTEDTCGAFVNYEIPEVSGICNEIDIALRQNLSNTVDGSFGCGLNRESRHLRVFDLAGMGVVGDFHIESIMIGIGFADTNDQQIDLNIYELEGPLLYENMTLVFSKQFILPTLGNMNYELFTNYDVERNKIIVVELVVPETNTLQFIAGYSLETEIYPSYFSSVECGWPEPTLTSVVGQNLSLIMELNGTVSNNITPTQTVGIERGGFFPLGTTTNTYTLPDGSSCTFDVTVEDGIAPEIICPENISVSIMGPVCDTFVMVPDPMTNDFCSPVSILNDFNNSAAASDIYSNGVTTVTWTASDENGNASTCSTDIEVVGSLGVDIDVRGVSCPGGNDGSIDLNISSSPPFTFSWTGGAEGQNPSMLTAGIYELTVTDNSNCEFRAIIVVTEPDEFTLDNLLITDATNGNANGNINVVVNGGTPPYIYNWSTGDNEPNITNLPMGTYTCTVVDANGCEFELGPFLVDDVVPVGKLEIFESLKVYPNPANDFLIIQFESLLDLESFEIFNLSGLLIHREKLHVSAADFKMDVSAFESGIYFVRFKAEDKVYTTKLIIE